MYKMTFKQRPERGDARLGTLGLHKRSMKASGRKKCVVREAKKPVGLELSKPWRQ